jgi:phosphate:Na+ symporter
MIFRTLLDVAGSLGLFLFGMKIMSDGIQKASGRRLQTVLHFMTGNRFLAVLTGFTITGLVQSSSATTVMVVGFVNAGLLALRQAIGVIMGANIGTTVTGWIVAVLGFKFSISIIVLPALAIGLPLRLSQRLGQQDWGEAITGFGLLFLGLDLLKRSVPALQGDAQFLEFMARLNDLGFLSFVIFVLFGTGLTVVLQSSSAAMAITLTMAFSGWIDYSTAAAIVLGENIGTTATAFIASIGANIHARRASRFHLLFNVTGVVWMAILFRPFLALVDILVPGAPVGAAITAHLAMFHTLFNVVNTGLFLGFVKQMEIIVKRVTRVRPGEEDEQYKLVYISTGVQDTPELNILNAQRELSRMAGIVEEMFERFLKVFGSPDKKLSKEVAELKKMEDYTDRMQEDISSFLAQCARDSLNEDTSANVSAMLRIAHELENLGDACFNLMVLAERRYSKDIRFKESALLDLKPYSERVARFITFIKDRLNQHLSSEELEKAYKYENKVNKGRDRLRKKAQKRLQDGANVRTELLYIEIVRQHEQAADHAMNVAQALGEMR